MSQPLYLTMLNDEFKKRQKTNAMYSLRAFARDIKISPASLSLIMNQKKGISEKTAMAIAQSVSWTTRQRNLFIQSAISAHSRVLKKRLDAQRKISRIENRAVLSTNDLESLQSWCAYAVMELIELPSNAGNVKWYANKLGVSIELIEKTLESLIRLGHVKIENGVHRATHLESTTTFDIPSSAIQDFHLQFMKLAEKALKEQNTQAREFVSMTLAFPEAEISEAKEMIRHFQESFAERFYSETKKTKSSVYQLNIQLFRLDKGESK